MRRCYKINKKTYGKWQKDVLFSFPDLFWPFEFYHFVVLYILVLYILKDMLVVRSPQTLRHAHLLLHWKLCRFATQGKSDLCCKGARMYPQF